MKTSSVSSVVIGLMWFLTCAAQAACIEAEQCQYAGEPRRRL